MKKTLQKGFDKIIKYAQTEDMGKVLAITGSLGWGLSCLAYTGALLLNKGIPSDQKKFLVPQELADGAINVSLFLFFTSKANKFGKELVASGKVLPKQLKKEVGEIKANLGSNVEFKEVEKHLSKENIEKLGQFKKSFPALISILGSILAANIVTPIVRNIVASKFQKKHVHHDTPVTQSKTAISQQERPTNIVKPLLIKPYSSGVQGQIRI